MTTTDHKWQFIESQQITRPVTLQPDLSPSHNYTDFDKTGQLLFVLVDDLVRGWLAHGTLTHRASELQKLLVQRENLLSRTTGEDFFEPWIKKTTNTWHFTFSWLVYLLWFVTVLSSGTIMGNYFVLFYVSMNFSPRQFHFGQISLNQKVTSLWATALCPLV